MKKGKGVFSEIFYWLLSTIIVTTLVNAYRTPERTMDISQYKGGIIVSKDTDDWWYGQNVQILHNGEITKPVMIYEIIGNELAVGDTIK